MSDRPDKWAAGCVVVIIAAMLGLLIVGGVTLYRSADRSQCIGADDYFELPDARRTAYRLSTRNIIIGAVLVETIVAPIYVMLEASFCPRSPEEKPERSGNGVS